MLSWLTWLIRSDAAPVPALELRADGGASHREDGGAALINAMSGIGGANDSGTTARPNPERLFLSVEELAAMMRGSLYRRIVELHPKWATSRGWRVEDDTDDERPLERELRDLNTRQAFRRADVWARALGESRLLIVTEGDDANPSQPLNPKRAKRIIRLELLDRREFSAIAFNANPADGPIGEPVMYSVHPIRSGSGGAVMTHRSRLLRFFGDETAPSQQSFGVGGWGADAIGQTMWDALRHYTQIGAGGARVAQELSVAVFTLNAPAPAAADQSSAWLSKINALNRMKSIAQSIWLSVNEKFERVAANPTGFKDLSEHARGELALLVGAPLTLLFGEAPGGLSTDGESWLRMWGSDVASYQDAHYRGPLEQLVGLLYAMRGTPPPLWSVEFNPLGEMSERERAEVRLLTTQADSQAILDGVLTPEDVRTRYTQPGGYAFALQPLDDLPVREIAEVSPEDEESAKAMVLRAMQAGKPPAPAAAPPDAP